MPDHASRQQHRSSDRTGCWMRTRILAVLVEQDQPCDRRKEQPEKEPQPSVSSCGLRPVGAKEAEQVENHSFRCVVHCCLLALFRGHLGLWRRLRSARGDLHSINELDRVACKIRVFLPTPVGEARHESQVRPAWMLAVQRNDL